MQMGLYVLKHSREELIDMSFEEILNDINDRPRHILTQVRKNDKTMY